MDAAFIRESVLDPIAHVTSGQLERGHLDAIVEHYRAVR